MISLSDTNWLSSGRPPLEACDGVRNGWIDERFQEALSSVRDSLIKELLN